MKTTIFFMTIFCGSALADQYVNPYYNSRGTLVAPHIRSSPDGNPYNNYSTQGNVNPYTQERGTVNPPSYGQGLYSNPSSSSRNSGYGNPYSYGR